MNFDIIIKNGRVIDPKRNIEKIENIYIKDGKVIFCADESTAKAKDIIDAKNCLVLPGLIDYHTHLGFRQSDFGLAPDLYTIPNGITSAVDAGSGGTCNCEGMIKNIFQASIIDIKCYLNVTATGIITEQHAENLDPSSFDAKKMEYLFNNYRETLIGLKVRVGRKTSCDYDLLPLKKAVELADLFKCGICLHATDLISGYDKIISLLRKNDVICHCYQNNGLHTILSSDGRVSSAVKEGRDKGIIFDCASGRINYSLYIMKKALDDGFLPDIISSDAISYSIYGSKLHSLLSVMNQFLNLNVPIFDIIKSTTVLPARLMSMENVIGTLSPGSNADVFIAQIVESDYEVIDKFNEKLRIQKCIIPKMTIKKGNYAYRDISFNAFDIGTQ